jgi:hypothetical protein
MTQWLGVTHGISSDLCYWLLLESGKIIARTTLQHVVRKDYLNNNVKLEIERFDRSVEDQLSVQNIALNDQNAFCIQDEPDDVPTVTREENYGNMNLPDTPEADNVNYSLIDKSST